VLLRALALLDQALELVPPAAQVVGRRPARLGLAVILELPEPRQRLRRSRRLRAGQRRRWRAGSQYEPDAGFPVA